MPGEAGVVSREESRSISDMRIGVLEEEASLRLLFALSIPLVVRSSNDGLELRVVI